jgi:hypothetical protein
VSWMERLGQLERFKLVHGHARVPKRYGGGGEESRQGAEGSETACSKGPSRARGLGAWVQRQRQVRAVEEECATRVPPGGVFSGSSSFSFFLSSSAKFRSALPFSHAETGPAKPGSNRPARPAGVLLEGRPRGARRRLHRPSVGRCSYVAAGRDPGREPGRPSAPICRGDQSPVASVARRRLVGALPAPRVLVPERGGRAPVVGARRVAK